LVLMLTLLHGRLRLPICKTVSSAKKLRHCRSKILLKISDNALMFLRCIAHPQMPHSILGCMD